MVADSGGWVQSDNPKPYSSYGNGTAMRVSACGFVADSLDKKKERSIYYFFYNIIMFLNKMIMQSFFSFLSASNSIFKLIKAPEAVPLSL